MDRSPDKPRGADPGAETAAARADGSSSGGSGRFFASQPAEPDPKRIGKYRIHHRLGSGGMGLVYLATRDDDQFNKRVAIKVIKKGMDSEAIISRFEQERQVLAALNHPNIARLLDGGLTDDGRPYFVMEHVEGLPIDEYCDNNRLPIEQRLELFRTLCNAVHHAHTNLIVHRDLKPGNVIVSPDGMLKLLDFGIAKLLNPSLATFSNDPTQTFLRLMTPEYASPEQVRGDPISTSSDVYSLGVVLYELITGRRPYAFKTRLQNEIERIICNEDPERPSTAITHLPPTAESEDEPQDSPTRATTVDEIAKVRDARPDRLRRQIAGDLDNMILMAMRKEPRRRYASAEQFAEDIKRHLTGMPVIARPATWNYQFSKFVHRNKGGVGAVAAVIAVLVIGIVATYLQWQRAERAAIEARNQGERAAKAEEEVKVSFQFYRLSATSLFGLSDELSRIVGTTEVRNVILDRTQEYVRAWENLDSQRSDLRLELADGYGRLGDLQGGLRSNNVGKLDAAMKSYDQSFSVLSSLLKEQPNDIALQRKLALVHVRRGNLHWKLGHPNEAISERQAALALVRPLALSFPNDLGVKDTLAVVLLELSGSLFDAGQIADARAAVEESIKLRERHFEQSPSDAAVERGLTAALTRLSEIFVMEGNLPEAMRVDERVLVVRQRLWEADKENTQRIRDLAYAHLFAGQNAVAAKSWDKAIAHYQRGVEMMVPLAATDKANQRYQGDLGQMYIGLAGAMDARANDTGDLANISPENFKAVFDAYEKGTGFMQQPSLTDARVRIYMAQSTCSWGLFEYNTGRPQARTRLEEGRKLLLAADPGRQNQNTPGLLQLIDKALGESAAGTPGG